MCFVFVMAGLVTAIHVLSERSLDLDVRNESGHHGVFVRFADVLALQCHAINPVIAHCSRQFDHMAMVREQDDLTLRAARRQ